MASATPGTTNRCRSARRPRWAVLTTVAVLGIAIIATALVVLKPSSAGAGTGAARLVLSTTRVTIGDAYVATAAAFTPGEGVRFSWTGPTNGVMDTSAADSTGGRVHAPIVEKDPPGDYTITATGLTSGRVASAALRVVAYPTAPTP